jgi:hypothetical protein
MIEGTAATATVLKTRKKKKKIKNRLKLVHGYLIFNNYRCTLESRKKKKNEEEEEEKN